MPCRCQPRAPSLTVTKHDAAGRLLEQRTLCLACDAREVRALVVQVGTQMRGK